MNTFDPNHPLNSFHSPSNFDHHRRYEDHRSSFNHHDHFSKHTQYHHQTQTANNHFHNDSHRSQIDEGHARAAREQTAQMTRNYDPMTSMSIFERLKRIFFSVD